MTLAASTRGMESDIRRGIERASDAATIDVSIDSGQLGAQGDAAGREFAERFEGQSTAGAQRGGESFLDGFSGKISALGTAGGPIGAALAAAGAVALGAGKLIADQVMAGMEQEVNSDRIAASLGLSEQDSAAFGQRAGELYAANFGDSIGDVAQSIADVQSTLQGAAPGAIDDMTAKAITFRDVFGTDVAESIANAQNLVANGLAPDAATAFDLMTTAAQRVPAAMRDELPEALNEYSTFFQSLGFSAEEAFGLVVNTAPRGQIALDKLGDSLKEFSLLATDIGAKPVQDALASMGLDGATVANNLLAGGAQTQGQFDQIVDSLLAIQDPGQQAAAAIALFGTPLEDLNKAKIPEFLRSLNDADQAMAGFSGSSERMVTQVGDNAMSSVESAKRSLEVGVSSMQASMADAYAPLVQDAATWLTENKDSVAQFFTTTANGAAEFGGVMFGVGAAVTSTLGLILKATGDTTSFMLDSFASMAGGASEIADAVGLDGLAGKLKDAEANLGGMADKFDGMGNGMLDLSSGLAAGARNLHDFDANMGSTQTNTANTAAQIQGVSAALANIPGSKQIDINAIVVYRDQQGRAIDPSQLLGFNTRDFASAGDAQRARRGDDYSPGGAATPPPAVASTTITPGPAMAASPAAPARSGSSSSSSSSEPPPYFDPSLWQVAPSSTSGSGIDEAILANVPAGRYTQEERGDLTQGLADCSSAVEDLVNLMDGRPTAGAAMATGNADQWLQEHGFLPGAGGLGDMRVAFNSGHMQATLPDGTPFNWGSNAAAARGGVGGSGADDPALTSRYYRPATGASMPAGYGPAMSVAGPSEVTGPGGFVVDPQAVYDAESASIRARNDLEQKRLALLELEAKGNATQSQILAAKNNISEQERAVRSAEAKEAEARQGKFKEASAKAKSGDSSAGGESLGKGLFDGILQGIGLDGSLFSNPFEMPNVKSAMAVANFGGGLLQQLLGGGQDDGSVGPSGGGGGGALPFGGLADLLKPMAAGPQNPIQLPNAEHGGGAGAPPGPALVVQGNVGWDPRALTQRSNAHQDQTYRQNMSAARPS